MEHERQGEDPVKKFLKPGEKVWGNEMKAPTPFDNEPYMSPEQVAAQLLASGRYESVRVAPEAAFTTTGEPIPYMAAIIVTPKQESQ